jgi:uncharacterized membrane protein YgcG
VALGFDFGEDFEDALVGADQEGGPLDPHDFFAVHILFFENIKLFAHGFVYISKEGIREVVLFAEFPLRLRRIAGNAEDDGAGRLDFFELVAKAAGLNGAAGRVGFGIEKQDDRLTGEVLQMDGLVVIVLENKIGDFVVDFHFSSLQEMDARATPRELRLFQAVRIMSRVWTGRPGWFCVAAIVAASVPALAQYPGHVDEDKQQTGTHLRATAVLEFTGDLGKIKQSRLVPIAIWDGMQYQPGGLYLAQPAPLAVESGTQYELESSGKPKGFFNIDDAEDLAGLWIGVGSFQAPPAPKPRVPAARSGHTYEVRDVDPDKPHFAHRPADENQSGGSGSGSGSQSGNGPTLHSRTGNGSDSGSSSGGSSSSGQGDVDPDRPTFHRRSNASTEIPGGQPAVDPDRPHLSYAAPDTQAKLAAPKALFGLPADMQQMTGVSDTRTGDTESWVFSWANPEDEGKMKAALETIAQQAMAPPAPASNATTKKVSASGTRRKTHEAAPPPLPALADEDFRTYSLSFGGGATMVLTAQSADKPVKYVTIIAQPDFYGQPKVLLKMVTSDNELDVAPRFLLVDAVDTEGNGRANLIFELRGQTFRQFAIYRVADGQATQVFATQPAASAQAATPD